MMIEKAKNSEVSTAPSRAAAAPVDLADVDGPVVAKPSRLRIAAFAGLLLAVLAYRGSLPSLLSPSDHQPGNSITGIDHSGDGLHAKTDGKNGRWRKKDADTSLEKVA